MTARSKNRREKNRKLKAEKNKQRALKKLQKLGKKGDELMEICSDVVDQKKLEEIKQKKLEDTIKEEFIKEQREVIEGEASKKKKKIKTINENTGKVHIYDANTMKDQYGSYPPWLNVRHMKKKIRRKERIMKRSQYRNGKIHF